VAAADGAAAELGGVARGTAGAVDGVAAADGAAAKLGGADRGERREWNGSWTGLDWELGLLRGWGVLGGFRREGKRKRATTQCQGKIKCFVWHWS
jgi:hypothetical protein